MYVALASLGFGMRIKDVAQLVESYVQDNDHEKGKKVLKFKGRPGYPGPDWLKSFMDKNSLSLKEATRLSCARYNATKNLFIIYNYFHLLEKNNPWTWRSKSCGINLELRWIWVTARTQKMQNNISKRAKNYAGISFFQKHLYQIIKIIGSNKGTPLCVFSIILVANLIYQTFQKFQKNSLRETFWCLLLFSVLRDACYFYKLSTIQKNKKFQLGKNFQKFRHFSAMKIFPGWRIYFQANFSPSKVSTDFL